MIRAARDHAVFRLRCLLVWIMRWQIHVQQKSFRSVQRPLTAFAPTERRRSRLKTFQHLHVGRICHPTKILLRFIARFYCRRWTTSARCVKY